MTKRKFVSIAAIALIMVAALAILGIFFQDHDLWQDRLSAFLEQARGTPWALPLVCGLYIVSGIVLFPVSILNLVCSMVFGLWGIAYALIGGMLNTAVYFWTGHYVRHYQGGKKLLAHPKIKPLDEKLHKAGVAGAVFLHTLPAPSFSAMNFIGGLSSVNFAMFFSGTFIALIPGAIARGLVGDSLMKVLLSPTAETWVYLSLGLVLWVVLIWVTQTLLKRFVPPEVMA